MTKDIGVHGRKPWFKSAQSHHAPGPGETVTVFLRDVTLKSNQGIRLLNDVSLGFRSASLTAIYDPTGKRARALFDVIASFSEPDSGAVFVRRRHANRHGRSASVALITASSPLNLSLTVCQNLVAPLALTGVSAQSSTFHSITQILGLKDLLDTPTSSLKKIDLYALLLAQAVIAGGDIILADDPTFLPAPQRLEALDLLARLTQFDATVICATADAQVAASCKRAVLLANSVLSADLIHPTLQVIEQAQSEDVDNPATYLGPIPSALPATSVSATSASPSVSSSLPVSDSGDEAGASTLDQDSSSQAQDGEPLADSDHDVQIAIQWRPLTAHATEEAKTETSDDSAELSEDIEPEDSNTVSDELPDSNEPEFEEETDDQDATDSDEPVTEPRYPGFTRLTPFTSEVVRTPSHAEEAGDLEGTPEDDSTDTDVSVHLNESEHAPEEDDAPVAGEDADSTHPVDLPHRDEEPDPITQAIRLLASPNGREALAEATHSHAGQASYPSNGTGHNAPTPQQAEVIDKARKILDELPGSVIPE